MQSIFFGMSSRTFWPYTHPLMLYSEDINMYLSELHLAASTIKESQATTKGSKFLEGKKYFEKIGCYRLQAERHRDRMSAIKSNERRSLSIFNDNYIYGTNININQTMLLETLDSSALELCFSIRANPQPFNFYCIKMEFVA